MPAFLPIFLWLHLFFLWLSPCACLCWVCAGSPHALEFMLFLTTVSLHSVYVGVLSASLHPRSIHLCSLPPHFMLSVVSLCLPLVSFSLSFGFLLCLSALSLSVFLFPSLTVWLYIGGQRKGIVYYCQYKRSHIQFLIMKKMLKMNDFSVFLTSHYFQLPMLPAVGHMNNLNYQGDIHERIKG